MSGSRALAWAILLVILVGGPAAAQHPNPDGVRIETSDVVRFIDALDSLDRAGSYDDSVSVLTSHYLEPGSPGLDDWVRVRVGSAERLLEEIRARPAYYAHLRTSLAGLSDAEPSIRTAFRRFERLYPDAVFTDVYFLVGRMNSGGTTSRDKILIGAEMYGLDEDAPTHELEDWQRAVLRDASELENIAVHELMHINQPRLGGGATLLQRSLREGGADFITELVTGDNINRRIHEWANSRERDLWAEFRAEMDGIDLTRWLYNGANSGDGPGDLGYWMGYRIARAFYQQAADERSAADERRAIRAILRAAVEPETFLDNSGYARTVRE